MLTVHSHTYGYLLRAFQRFFVSFVYLYSAHRRELMPVNMHEPYDFCFAWCTYILSVEVHVVLWYIALESLFMVQSSLRLSRT